MANATITDRDLAVWVRDHKGAAPADLASKLGVSERTVRTYVRRANDAMDPFAHIALKYGGYTLVCADARAFAAWLSGGQAKWAQSGLPATHDGRVAYLTDDLLSRNGWITKDELAERLFVSNSTISHDLAVVEKNLASFGLSIERRPRYGIRVRGDEMGRRLCIAATVAQGLFDGSGRGGDGHVNERGRELLQAASDSVDAVLREDGFGISTLAHRNLLVHIAVALLRMEEGCYVPMSEQGLAQAAGTREHEVAAHIAERLEERLGVALPPEEVAYIAIHLASKQMIAAGTAVRAASADAGAGPDAAGEKTFSPHTDDPAHAARAGAAGAGDAAGNDAADARAHDAANGIVISDEVWAIVGNMLDLVHRVFNFDFRDNLELRMNLARHIVPLGYRLTYNMTLKNPLLQDIKERYPLAWSMAAESSASLVEAYGRVPSDDEVGYLALSFALALEREQTHAEGKSILLVCASGVGTAKLLKHLYRKEFGQWLSEVQTCDAAHVADVDLAGVDYVFTTVPLDVRLPVPVREVSAFLDEAEAEDVRTLLRGMAPGAAGPAVCAYFDRRLFFGRVPGTTKDEVLGWLCERRVEFGGAGEGFAELVRRREETMPTTFGNLVAMPHPLEATSEKTLVTVGITEKPVDWGGHEVQAVFLLSVARDELPPRSFYDALATLMVSEEAVGELVRCRSWDALVGLLAKAAADAGT